MSGNSGDTLKRQWVMLRQIPRAPRKITVGELQSRLEEQCISTTSRTIQRDLEDLSERFALVVDQTSKPYGWSWAKDANIEFAPRLSTSQAVALLLSRAHLRTLLPQSMTKELVPLYDLAEKELTSSGWKDWHRRTAILPTSFPLLAPTIGAGVLDAVHGALATRKCLLGRYRAKGSAMAKEMKIHPLGLLVRGSVQYLVCTLRDYKDIKHLALHRLSEVSRLNEPCVPPEGFDFAHYATSTASRYQAQGTIRMVARFTAEAAEHLRDAPVSKDQVITDLEDGEWVELTATVEDDQTLRWWLLGFGSKVEVMAPPALRQALRNELQAAGSRYLDQG